MNLRTILAFPPYAFKIDHTSQVLTLGSCFSEVVGQFLTERKFQVLNNPFGTVYNPVSLLHLVEMGLGVRALNENKWVERDGLIFHMDVHSHFWGCSRGEFLDKWNEACHAFQKAWSQMDLLVLTLGTAWVYTKDSQVVNNCQKVPASHFEKRRLTVEEQLSALRTLVGLRPGNSQVLISVSPVRHIKDGLAENSLSKALLRVSATELCDSEGKVHYFPAYEAMMDDLRDYRFYKEDLIHPTDVAEGYICEAFMQQLVSSGARERAEAWQKVRTALKHRPLQEGTAAHRTFLENLLQKIETFRPHFDVSTEWAEVQAKYSALGRTSQG